MTLNDVYLVPEETSLEKRLTRCRVQLAMMATLAHNAAEALHPGFQDLAEQLVTEEDELLHRLETLS